jgi:hypothetical protein
MLRLVDVHVLGECRQQALGGEWRECWTGDPPEVRTRHVRAQVRIIGFNLVLHTVCRVYQQYIRCFASVMFMYWGNVVNKPLAGSGGNAGLETLQKFVRATSELRCESLADWPQGI